MSQKKHKTTWLLPYGFVVLMIVALILEGKDGLPSWANEFAGIGIVIIAFGSIALWVHLNTSALLDEEIEKAKHEKLIISEYPPTQPTYGAQKKDTNEGDLIEPLSINPMHQSRN